ncbi:MAG: DNA polymerase III subunit gamma/tau [Piscirickettsiaceae bacterium]|nr:MAG: DNA polymerase III subunit gamma/tau [Piscirickettsiaceae bacterium]PCI70960.1 MAG: DNA polymerase III subunit gamma/tau [Piscirickettsiaceae bacterium]
MSYKVFARKWRPLNFAQVVGQEHVVRALVNGLEHDRLHHAYLFTGTRGVGKTTIARVFAKALNCPEKVGAEPCCKCNTCLEIDQGYYPDLIEVDAASKTGVDDTRDLLENVQYAPVSGQYKVYLIDEVHMFSKSSFNALLKTLEEPPEHVKFLLATTDPQKLPVTVLSRCLQFNLKRLYPEQIEGQFKLILESEGIDYQQPATERLAHVADGSMRDGLSLLDQAIVHGNGSLKEADVLDMLGSVAREPIVDLLRALATKQGPAVMQSIAALDEFAPDYEDVLQALLTLLHRIAVYQIVPSQELDQTMLNVAAELTKEDVQLYYQIGLVGQKDLSLAPSPKVGFEMVLLRMLTFSPVQTEQREHTVAVVKKTPSIEPKQKAVEKTTVGNTAKKAAPKLTIPEKKTLENLTVAKQQESAPNKALPWHQLVPLLNLDPMTLQLANNATLTSLDDSQCELLLAAGHVSLNKKSEEALAIALSGHFGRKLRLVFRQDEANVDTPNAIVDQQKAERQQQAEEDIRNNTTVNKILELFDGKIIEGSIKPID